MGTFPASPAIAPLSLWLQRLLALVLAALTAYAVADYPFARLFLGLALAAYAVWLHFRPTAWLLALPVALPLVNLAPWSGRFYLEDFDFFIAATVAAALWQGSYSLAVRPRFALAPWLLVAAFFATHCVAMLRGVLPLAALDANAFSNYYSHYNGLRVGKSLLWAVALIPPTLRAFTSERARARADLGLGVCLGLVGAGLAVLWERGVFVDWLYGANIYEKLSGLTNFSANYRATALFAEMHTGGEAIDGYLALAVPFALAGLALGGPRGRMAAAGLALPAGLYAALVTFSRGTYAAVAVSLLVFSFFYLQGFLRSGGKALWPVPFIVAAAAAACVVLYGKGGFYALAAALGMLGGGTLLGFLGRPWPREWLGMSWVGLFLAGFSLMMRGLLTSKWASNGLADSLALCLPLSAALLGAGGFMGGRARGVVNMRGMGVGLLVVAAGLAVCVPGLSGSYVKSRFSTVEDDFGGRFGHWRHAVGLMEASWDTFAFGMGLGTFPHAYLWGNETEKSSIAALHKDGGNIYLKLSNSMDLAMGQRVGLAAGETYRLSLDARTQAPQAPLDLSICRRHILSPADYECVSAAKVLKAGPWQQVDWLFDIGPLGDGGRLGRRPLVLRINYFHYNPEGKNNLPLDFIDIDNIKLMDRYGEDHLANGDFQAGLDRWYPYSDHYHLPLHIKNLGIDVYFEQGALGLAAFAALNLYVLACGARLARQGDVFALGLLSSLAGFLSVGLVGTLYDVPRVIFLFFLLQFALLAQDPAQLSFARASRPPLPAPRKRDSFIKPLLK
jgi:hypothetical protein